MRLNFDFSGLAWAIMSVMTGAVTLLTAIVLLIVGLVYAKKHQVRFNTLKISRWVYVYLGISCFYGLNLLLQEISDRSTKRAMDDFSEFGFPVTAIVVTLVMLLISKRKRK